jgi:hypothetical protein
MSHSDDTLDHAPLISPGFVWKLTGVIAVLCLATLAIALTGRLIGGSIALAGNTTDQSIKEIVIGNDVLSLPANVIRFESQRTSGVQGAVDTYFTWPGMAGYSEANRDVFNQVESADGLIFARITQSTMSRDMSGRLDPIYQRLTEGQPVAGPNGLDSVRLAPGAGYANELMYVERRAPGNAGERPYAVRCLVEDASLGNDFATRTGCQRDIRLGADLSVTYRFSINLLPHWRQIENDVRARLEAALVR